MDVLKFAINMEREGEKYYRRQAEMNANNSLHTVCILLAEQEEKHALLLSDLLNSIPVRSVEDDPLAQIKGIFKNIEDFKSEINQIPGQIELYSMALKKEKESIDLYKKLLMNAPERQKPVFEFLIQQEMRHYDILDELILRLSHAEDWVESAEFGLWSNRGEY